MQSTETQTWTRFKINQLCTRLGAHIGTPVSIQRDLDLNEAIEAITFLATQADNTRQILADAPHDAGCESLSYYRPSPCDCWKAGL